jgi:hypothetical protein
VLCFRLTAKGAMAVFATVGSVVAHRHFKRLKKEREEESICTFARALPARAHDTWVVRAVYEELFRLARVPIRPTDDLKKDLKIDPDDLEDAAFDIARRAGRSMDCTKEIHFSVIAVCRRFIVTYIVTLPTRQKRRPVTHCSYGP